MTDRRRASRQGVCPLESLSRQSSAEAMSAYALLPDRSALCIGAILLGALVGLPPGARAAHPLLTEDTGTQGSGGFELELGASFARIAGGRAAAFEPQLSYGIFDNLDAIVQVRLFQLAGSAIAQDGRRLGFGDTALDAKWRFAERGTLSLGIRAGIDMATAARGIEGYGGTAYHATLIATADALPWALSVDAGYRRAPPGAGLRRDRYRASAAAVYAANESLRLAVNPAVESNPVVGNKTWPAVLLFGAIATMSDRLDVDLGWQTRLTSAAPRQVVSVGATLRW